MNATTNNVQNGGTSFTPRVDAHKRQKMEKYIVLLFILSLPVQGITQISDTLLNEALKKYPMLEICEMPGFSEKVLCGTLEVYENYFTNDGQKIPIEVVLLPAKTSNPNSSAFTLHWGGNGDAAKNKTWFFRPGRGADKIRMNNDVVLIDDRGTGASNIRCVAMDSLQPYSYAFVYDKELITDCLHEVKDKFNLELYNTPGVVRDYDKVRDWLGLEQFDFFGISYGVRVGLEYMRNYPDRIRTLTVKGCVPPGFNYINEMDKAIQEQLEILFERCKNDTICNTYYPRFKEELYELRDRLAVKPIEIDYELENGYSKKITIDDLLFRRIVGHQILNGDANEALPLLIHRANEENYAPLIIAGGDLSLDMPVFLSQFCPEEIDRFEYQAVNQTQSFTQGAIAEEKRSACDLWANMPNANWLNEPLKGVSQILILTGENDANTPIHMGDQIKDAFPDKSRHIILPYQGHGSSETVCQYDIISQFVDTKNLESLDTTCLTSIHPQPFAYELNLADSEFELYSGTYSNADPNKILELSKQNGIHYLMDEYSKWTGPSQLLYKGNHTFSLIDCERCKIVFEMDKGKPVQVKRIYGETTIFEPNN